MSDNNHHDDDHSHGGTKTYMAVFGFLVILTAASFAIGNWTSVKESSPAVVWAAMMAISCGKAMLVILFFMHLKWEANWKYVLTVPCMMMSTFLVCMLIPDVGMRQRHYAVERIWHAPSPAAADHADDHDEAHPEKDH